MTASIRLSIEGPLARVTLDRPEVLNAGDAAWVRDLNGVVNRLAAEPDVRVVVLTGAGRAFCTGVDLKALAGGSFGLDDFVAWEDAMTAIERMDKFFVAGIHGYCLDTFRRAMETEFKQCLASDDHRRAMEAIRQKNRAG